ncbi:Lipopolysaccharide export system permease protein LptG [hydrothermal vent metagenome]|uniref:Lipopolysaccharide export system permease protein LptG n=1 Tax=hydrothermal vent metagenome TaxID=652676 RepID=A0A3B1BEQ7_9ZZZZ
MKILDRYIGQVVMQTVLAVVTVLAVLFGMISFANEADKIGMADYTVSMAFMHMLLKLPLQIYQMFPLSALLGTMMGLGMLANHSELVVVRAAGVSIRRIILAVMKVMLLLILLVVFVGEVIAPPAYQYAVHSRVKAMAGKFSLNTDYGLWARDGGMIIHVRRVENDGRLLDIRLYDFDRETRKMRFVLSAESGVFDGEQWLLSKVHKGTILKDKLVLEKMPTLKWKTLLDPDLINIVTVRSHELSSFKLWNYIKYLKDNNLKYEEYELAFYNRLFMPLAIIAMVLIAVPFVFVSQRNSSIGQKIVIGFLIGIVFYIGNRLIGEMGLVYDYPPILAAALPTFLVIIMAAILLRRVR